MSFRHIPAAKSLPLDLSFRKNELLSALTQAAVEEIDAGTPVSRGILRNYLCRWRVVPTGRGHTAQVGPLQNLNIGVASPRHTIRDFLRWYRGYRGVKKPRHPGGKFNPRLAWWYLTDEERRMLEGSRDAGMFGGPYDPEAPKYMGAVNEGWVPGTKENADFVRDIHAAVRAKVPMIIRSIMDA